MVIVHDSSKKIRLVFKFNGMLTEAFSDFCKCFFFDSTNIGTGNMQSLRDLSLGLGRTVSQAVSQN